MSLQDDGPFGERTWLAQLESGLRWWERLRWIYNLIMLALGIACVSLFMGASALAQEDTWFGVVAYGIMCNFGYFAGPVVDMYVTVFTKGKVQMNEARWVLFAFGTLLSLFVMVFLLMTMTGFGEIAHAD